MKEAPQNCWKRIGTWGDRSCPELKAQVHCRNCPVFSAGAAAFLDVAVPPTYLTEQARHYAQPKEIKSAGARSVVIFRLGAEWLALPTAVFSEISRVRTVRSLPHRVGGVVLGIVAIRGELLLCVSLAAALGLAPSPVAGPTARLAVIKRAGDRFVFPADEIAVLHRFDDSDLTPVPATLRNAQATYTRSMLPWRQKTVGVLDDQLLFHTLNRSLE